MSVKITLTPRQAAALYVAASVGVTEPTVPENVRHNASKALNRLQRRLVIHRVEISWANEGPEPDEPS